ncbi:MAG: metal-dependent hydrolase [Myxococcota bacterium]
MDPLAHTLVGASLSETGLKKVTPLATATLLIGANLPDIDGVATFLGSDASLHLRRGWTHGILAAVVLPLVLAGLMLAYDKYWRLRRNPDADPARPKLIVALSYGAFLTHPLLDWLNTYGVRLLMPFDGRWFYGDALFIVDPWMWLLAGSSVVLARSDSKLGIGAWAVLGSATSGLVLGVADVPLGVKIGWGIGVLAIIGMRTSGWFQRRSRSVATITLALLVGYIGAMITASAVTATIAAEKTGADNPRATFSSPTPGNPFAREGVIQERDRYVLYTANWLATPPIEQTGPPLATSGRNGPIVEAALDAPHVRGFTNWMRFPVFEVEDARSGYLVTIRDLRYVRPDDQEGFGFAQVWLDADLEPIRAEVNPRDRDD